MKHIFGLLVVSIFFHCHCYAQLKIYTGGGLNISNVYESNTDFFKTNSAVNYYLSVRPEIELLEKVAVGVDIQFSRKGYLVGDDVSTNINGYRMQYLDILPQVQYKIINALGVYGGIGIGFRLSEKQKIDDVWKEAITKLSNTYDASYILGLRFFPIDKITAHIHVAGSLGNFYNQKFTNAVGEVIDIVSKLQNFQIGVSYKVF